MDLIEPVDLGCWALKLPGNLIKGLDHWCFSSRFLQVVFLTKLCTISKWILRWVSFNQSQLLLDSCATNEMLESQGRAEGNIKEDNRPFNSVLIVPLECFFWLAIFRSVLSKSWLDSHWLLKLKVPVKEWDLPNFHVRSLVMRELA